jgi:hypothetical protein
MDMCMSMSKLLEIVFFYHTYRFIDLNKLYSYTLLLLLLLLLLFLLLLLLLLLLLFLNTIQTKPYIVTPQLTFFLSGRHPKLVFCRHYMCAARSPARTR